MITIPLADRIKYLASVHDVEIASFDLETTVRLMPDGSYSPMPRGRNGARPFAGQAGLFSFYDKGESELAGHLQEMTDRMELRPDRLYAGHNIKFDIQHFLAHSETKEFPTDILLWDTMVAEYILSGQQEKMISLADIGTLTGSGAKQDLIGTNLKIGVTPDQIDEASLKHYLAYDCQLTENVARNQWDLAGQSGQRELIMIQSLATAAYAAAEHNGMGLDVAACIAARDGALFEANKATAGAVDIWRTLHGVPDWVPSAELIKPRALSMLFFGNPAMAEITFPVPRNYPLTLRKNQKNVKYVLKIINPAVVLYPAVIGLTEDDMKTGNAWYRVDEDVLGRIANTQMTGFRNAATGMLLHRKWSKLAETYYQPLLEHAAKHEDGIVHHTINQCIANTGRTTSEQPNAQNMPPEVRDVITPPTRGWAFLEMDFRQLEMCALAQLSGDPGLISAINNGDDIHYMTGQLVFKYTCKADETPEKRRIIKTINFGLAYGGGAFTLAEQAGVDVQVARDAIEAFYVKFPYTRDFNDRYYEEVVNRPERASTEFNLAESTTARVHTVNSVTGRRYVFTEQKTPDWLYKKTGARLTFAPTQTKNYPVQGFATGDIVPLFVALLREQLDSHHHFVNFVHDSVLLQIPQEPGGLLLLTQAVKQAVSELPGAIETLWGIKMRVPLKLEYKYGAQWGALSPLSL